jgi:hypothetical protein
VVSAWIGGIAFWLAYDIPDHHRSLLSWHIRRAPNSHVVLETDIEFSYMSLRFCVLQQGR